MYRKIKIYSIILAVIYAFLLGYLFYQGVYDFYAGIKQAMEETTDKKITGERSEIEVYHFKVEPNAGRYTYPETVINNVDEQSMQAEVSEYKIKTTTMGDKLPAYLIVLGYVRTFMAFVVLFGLFYIPFLFFKTIASVVKDRVIDDKTIRRIQRMGRIVTGYFIIDLFFYRILGVITVEHLFQLQHYKPVVDYTDCTLLILGLVLLLLAEILKVSLKMKEEQELTI
jgi:hypothetical protein